MILTTQIYPCFAHMFNLHLGNREGREKAAVNSQHRPPDKTCYLRNYLSPIIPAWVIPSCRVVPLQIPLIRTMFFHWDPGSALHLPSGISYVEIWMSPSLLLFPRGMWRAGSSLRPLNEGEWELASFHLVCHVFHCLLIMFYWVYCNFCVCYELLQGHTSLIYYFK